MMHDRNSQGIRLPDPRIQGPLSVEEAIRGRRSIRTYSPRPLTTREVSQILWAAQGITDPEGDRTAPSAGALFPLEVRIAAGNVEGLGTGVYRYRPGRHDLARESGEDPRAELSSASFRQDWMQTAAAIVVLSAVYERTTGKYGERGKRYVHMEVGHVAQNIYLQAETLGLGTVLVAAFDDRGVKKVLNLSPSEQPLGLLPVGGKP